MNNPSANESREMRRRMREPFKTIVSFERIGKVGFLRSVFIVDLKKYPHVGERPGLDLCDQEVQGW